MKLELSLVESPNSFSSIFNLITRKRLFIDSQDPGAIVTEAVKFLLENRATLEVTMPNGEALNSLSTKGQTYSVTDLFSFKYLMTTSGLDLIISFLDDSETTNAEEIPAGSLEYNIVDKLFITNGFVPSVTKLTMSQNDVSTYKIFDEIYNLISPFSKEMIEKDRILKSNIDLIKSTEELTGKYASGVAELISAIYSYLGKELIIIAAK